MLATAINTCPVGKHITVYLRNRRVPDGWITAYHGTTWENFKKIVESDFTLRPSLGAGWGHLHKQYGIRIPLIYFSPIFEKVEDDPEVHRKAIHTCLGYPTNLRTPDGTYYGEFETNDGTLPFTVVTQCNIAKDSIIFQREESNQVGILGDKRYHRINQITIIPRALTHPKATPVPVGETFADQFWRTPAPRFPWTIWREPEPPSIIPESERSQKKYGKLRRKLEQKDRLAKTLHLDNQLKMTAQLQPKGKHQASAIEARSIKTRTLPMTSTQQSKANKFIRGMKYSNSVRTNVCEALNLMRIPLKRAGESVVPTGSSREYPNFRSRTISNFKQMIAQRQKRKQEEIQAATPQPAEVMPKPQPPPKRTIAKIQAKPLVKTLLKPSVNIQDDRRQKISLLMNYYLDDSEVKVQLPADEEATPTTKRRRTEDACSRDSETETTKPKDKSSTLKPDTKKFNAYADIVVDAQ